MKTLIIYTSSTGFTKKYAQWIGEETKGDLITLKEAKKKNKDYFESYDNIIYGGWILAGKVSKLNWYKQKFTMWQNKKLAVFSVGASPVDSSDVAAVLAGNLNDEEKSIAKIFYCPGGLNYDKLKGFKKIMMKMLASMLAKKKDATESEKIKAERLAKSFDLSDKKFINPILEYLNA